jgi:DNA-binding NarL/FixJ family response regulator
MFKFDFTRAEYDKIIYDAMLNEELAQLLEYKIKGYSIIQISMKMNMSESTVKKKIKTLKNKILKVI